MAVFGAPIEQPDDAQRAFAAGREMVEERLISKEDAIRRIPADSLAHLLAPIFDRKSIAAAKKIASGLPAGPGAASGHVVFSADEAVRRAGKGEKVVLARIETSPEDLRGMIAAEGILTARGGVSSHAALVARQMGKVCVCGAAGVEIDYQRRTLSASGATLVTRDAAYGLPAYPIAAVDPTGAGDALAGAFIGRLARDGRTDEAGLREALAAGMAAASFAVASFGLEALAAATIGQLRTRAAWLAERAGTAKADRLYEGR